jgi:hypothetical protein
VTVTVAVAEMAELTADCADTLTAVAGTVFGAV